MIFGVNNDIETLATALYVKIDDMLRDRPDLAPARPATGTPLTLSDAELLAMVVMAALMGELVFEGVKDRFGPLAHAGQVPEPAPFVLAVRAASRYSFRPQYQREWEAQ
jgi:hypothetical protein